MKKIPCPECKGAGYITYMHPGTMNNPDLCGVISRPCQVCDGAGFQEVPLTNGDRIRAMTDEELAKALFNMQKEVCRHIAIAADFPPDELDFADEAPDILNWLKQPAEKEE